jgi:tRNA (guanine10-N2)-methyltransferase
MPQYLVRLAQAHESFRKVELQALADIAGVSLQFVKYEEDVSKSFVHRAITLSSTSSVTSSPVLFWVMSRKKKPNVASRGAKA